MEKFNAENSVIVNNKNYREYIETKILSKLESFIESGENYSFLLQVKSLLRKAIKQEIQLVVNGMGVVVPNEEISTKRNLFMGVSYLALESLNCKKEYESIRDFISFLCDEVTKLYSATTSEKIIEFLKPNFYLEFFVLAFSYFPLKNFKKQNLEIQVLQFLNKVKVKSDLIKKSGLYKLFAQDNLMNNDPINGYKFAIASENPDILLMFVDLHLNQTENELENLYFLCRMILEALLLENFKLASFLLVKKGIPHNLNRSDYNSQDPTLSKAPSKDERLKELTYDLSNKSCAKLFCSRNHPLINLIICVLSAINQRFSFEMFSNIVSSYMKWLNNDSGVLKAYVNQVSIHFYEKPVIKDATANFGLFNLLSNFV